MMDAARGLGHGGRSDAQRKSGSACQKVVGEGEISLAAGPVPNFLDLDAVVPVSDDTSSPSNRY